MASSDLRRPRRRALLVASGAYEDPQLDALRSASGDVTALAAVFRDPHIGQFDGVESLVDGTHQDVLERLEDFFREGLPRDLLVLYLSGHGVLQRKQWFYAARNTSLQRLSSTAVSDSWIKERMAECRSNAVVLLLDCCNSGAFIKGQGRKSSRDAHIEDRFEVDRPTGTGTVVLTASTKLEYAFEDQSIDDLGAARAGSFFTRHLVQGLESRSADLNGDGHVTIDELYEYVRHKLEIDPSSPQTPGRGGDAFGAIRIARGRIMKAVPAELWHRIESHDPDERMEAAWAVRSIARTAGLTEEVRDALETLLGDEDASVADVASRAFQGIARAPESPVPADSVSGGSGATEGADVPKPTRRRHSLAVRLRVDPSTAAPGAVVKWSVGLVNDGDVTLQDVRLRLVNGKALSDPFDMLPNTTRTVSWSESLEETVRRSVSVSARVGTSRMRRTATAVAHARAPSAASARVAPSDARAVGAGEGTLAAPPERQRTPGVSTTDRHSSRPAPPSRSASPRSRSGSRGAAAPRGEDAPDPRARPLLATRLVTVPDDARPGEPVRFTLTLTNRGELHLSGVTVRDQRDVVISEPFELAPDQEVSITWNERAKSSHRSEASVTAVAPDGERVERTARARRDGGESAAPQVARPVPTADAAADPRARPLLATRLVVLPEEARDGDPVNITLTLANRGELHLSRVTVRNPGGKVIRGPFELAPDEEATITWTERVSTASACAALVTAVAPNGEVVERTAKERRSARSRPPAAPTRASGAPVATTNVDELVRMAAARRHRARLTESLGLADVAIRLAPGSVPAHLERGWTCLSFPQRQHLNALAAFTRAGELGPHSAEAFAGRAIALLHVGDLAEARLAGHRALTLDRALPEARAADAALRMITGDPTARRDFERAAREAREQRALRMLGGFIESAVESSSGPAGNDPAAQSSSHLVGRGSSPRNPPVRLKARAEEWLRRIGSS